MTAARHGLAGRPVGSWQQADLGAALGAPPGRDWIVHGLALGTTHSEEGTS
jgi:nitroreductase